MVFELLIQPFVEFGFMRRALTGAVALSLGGAPIGVFLMLRRMSLTGDAMAHAILPGAAFGFLLAGLIPVLDDAWRARRRSDRRSPRGAGLAPY